MIIISIIMTIMMMGPRGKADGSKETKNDKIVKT
jgi:hypothetical protein